MKNIVLTVLALFSFSTSSVAQEIIKSKKIEATTKKSKKSNASNASKVAKVANPFANAPKVEGAGIFFQNETIDYGTIPANSDGKREFVFINNGNKPLIISNAAGSCGCTVPTFPKEPIMPGETGIIGVKYDTTRAGQPFTKNVTITSNAEGNPSKVLTIKGNVSPAAPVESPKI